MNMGRNQLKNGERKKLSINSLLGDAKHLLSKLANNDKGAMASSIMVDKDAFNKYKEFVANVKVKYQNNLPTFYFVKTDVTRAYDSIST